MTSPASMDSSSRLASSPPSSPPPRSSPSVDDMDLKDESSAPAPVSEAMLAEEEKMRKAGEKAEERRFQKAEEERQRDLDDGDEAVDAKFQKLEYLLGQSKIYATILMNKMQKEQEDAQRDDARREQRAERAGQKAMAERAQEATGRASSRRSTRAGAAAAADWKDAEGSAKDGVKKKQMPTRPKGRKNGGTIADYFKKDDLKAKSGKESMVEALEEAAMEQELNPQALGAQELRSARQPKLVTGGVMRSYQLEGLEWLRSLYENGLNGILADEMGLGKTVQTIAFLAFLREMGTTGPFLIAAPLSTLSNWVEEFRRWTPDVPVVLYHGDKQEREKIRRTKMKQQHSPEFPVVCTSYEICMNDRKFLQHYDWKFIIIDEGHRLKNLNCRLIRELKAYRSSNRLLITGTPLQNNLAELWSLLNFLMPEVFDTLESFESWFDFSALQEKQGHEQILQGEKKTKIISSLHAILKPFLLRRVKADVETSLPKKREYVLYAPLTTTQKELYREILEGNSRAYLEEKVVESMTSSPATATPRSTRNASLKRKVNDSGTSTPNKSAKSSRASTPATSLRGRKTGKRQSYKELSDRDYFKNLENEADEDDEEIGSEGQEEAERAQTIALAKKQIGQKKLQNPLMQLRLACNSPHNFYWPWMDGDEPDETLVTSSGKLMLLDRLLPPLFAEGHKVLIFSQFKTTLDIIETWATSLRDWKPCRIDGSVAQTDRQEQIRAFNADPAYNLFLLSTRAGGQGINLASADTVVLFDSDWNPQQDVQAQDRAHRIGQTRPVLVYRLATRGTVEEVLLEKADRKRRLEKLVIQKGKFRRLGSSSTAAERDDDWTELRRILSTDEFEKVEVGEGAVAGEILSDADLRTLMDRSPEAYERAEKGEERAAKGAAFKAVETKKAADGVGGLLEDLSTKREGAVKVED